MPMTTNYYPPWRATVGIVLGRCLEISIMEAGHGLQPELAVRHANSGEGFCLGPATVKRITELQEYLERLKIHAVQEPVR